MTSTAPITKQKYVTVPVDLNLEQDCLCAILLKPKNLLSMDLTIDDFYYLSHKEIFHSIEILKESGTGISLSTVEADLRERNLYDSVNAGMTFANILNRTPNTPEALAKLLKRKTTARNLLEFVGQIEKDIADFKPLEEILQVAHHGILSIESSSQYTAIADADRLADNAFKSLEAGTQSAPLTLGYTALDKICHSVQGGTVNIIGARTGMGKTMFSINLVLQQLKQGKTVIFFSLEMSAGELTNRILSLMTGIPNERFAEHRHPDKPNLTASETALFVQALDEFRTYSLYIDDSAPQIATPSYINSVCYRVQAIEGQLNAVFVDYLQLMSSGKKFGNRTQEVGYISHYLKGMSKTLNVPIFPLAQLNREYKNRKDTTPLISDIRESADIENDADLILLLNRNGFDEQTTDNTIDVHIAKHRHGDRGVVNLYLDLQRGFVGNLQWDKSN